MRNIVFALWNINQLSRKIWSTEDDLMQVFAQKICVDYVFGCDCDGVIYYADVKTYCFTTKKRILMSMI